MSDVLKQEDEADQKRFNSDRNKKAKRNTFSKKGRGNFDADIEIDDKKDDNYDVNDERLDDSTEDATSKKRKRKRGGSSKKLSCI